MTGLHSSLMWYSYAIRSDFNFGLSGVQQQYPIKVNEKRRYIRFRLYCLNVEAGSLAYFRSLASAWMHFLT
jgi:hypothetical protein